MYSACRETETLGVGRKIILKWLYLKKVMKLRSVNIQLFNDIASSTQLR